MVDSRNRVETAGPSGTKQTTIFLFTCHFSASCFIIIYPDRTCDVQGLESNEIKHVSNSLGMNNRHQCDPKTNKYNHHTHTLDTHTHCMMLSLACKH